MYALGLLSHNTCFKMQPYLNRDIEQQRQAKSSAKSTYGEDPTCWPQGLFVSSAPSPCCVQNHTSLPGGGVVVVRKDFI